jgi:hypothetical protein
VKTALVAAGLAGFSVMALEILTARWLAPGFGFTLTTWAFLISATLLAGSVGAAAGALLARGDSEGRAAIAFLAAAVLVAADGILAPGLVRSLLGLPLVAGTLLACALLVMPPVTALAAVMPLVAPRERADSGTGRVVGLLVAASTLGSLAGTLLAAVWLVPSCGLRHTSLGLSALLALFGGLVLLRRRAGAGAALAVVLLTVIAALPAPGQDGDATVLETPYGRIVAARGPSGLTIRVNGILQAAGPPPERMGEFLARGQYFELLPWLHPVGTDALLIGLGGGLVPRCLELYDIRTVSIELNADLVEIVREATGFAGEVRTGDGRALMARMSETFDFVILDAFQGEGLPSHLLTREALAEAAARLDGGGILCVHLIGCPRHPATASVAASLRAVLPHMLALRNGVADELQDIFLLGSRRRLDVPPATELARAGWMGNELFVPASGVVPTDDRNPLDRLNESLARALRRSSVEAGD